MSARSAAARVASFGLFALLGAAAADAVEVSGHLAYEARGFLHSPALARQSRHQYSFVVRPEFYREWDAGRQSVLFTPFARLDAVDARRSHFDVRELQYQRVFDTWELRAGVGKVFWGVAESLHLVDVVNQSDLVENVDGEDKLGQPMVNVALVRDWGTLNLFVLPGFRERTFPGVRGRLRAGQPVDVDRASYESGAGRHHVDLAARWSHFFGEYDVGVSHFIGTSRDPRLIVSSDPAGAPVLVPRYEQIHQTGLDLQATFGAWLWKLEAVHRSGQGPAYFASVAGLEYTLFGVGGSDADLGLLAEHLFDGRGGSAPQPFENEVFIGARLALNDAASTEILGGFIRDVEGDSTVFSIEASRRLDDRWRVELEARLWSGVRRGDPQFAFRRDDHLQFTVLRYF